MIIHIDISPGELIDKITILEIKMARILDPGRLAHVGHELAVLKRCRDDAIVSAPPQLAELTAALQEVNDELWTIEDDIRDCERRGDFGAAFVALARAVYRTNDQRAQLKAEINRLLDSGLVEVKSYASY